MVLGPFAPASMQPGSGSSKGKSKGSKVSLALAAGLNASLPSSFSTAGVAGDPGVQLRDAAGSAVSTAASA